MAKVLSSQSPSYLDRFRTQSQGFVILSNLLPRHWNLLEVHLTLLALAFGVDPGELPAHPSLDVATLSELLEPDPQHRVLPVAEGIVLTMTMVREMMHAMIRQKSVAPSSRVLKWVSEAAEMNADTRLGPMRDYAQLLSLYFDLFERLYDESVEARTLLTASEVVEELVLAIYPAIASFDLLDADGEIALLGAEPASASAVRPSAHESPLPELSQLFPAPATPVNEIDVEWQRARGENVAEMQPPGQDIPTDLPSGLDAGLDLDALHLETDITSGPTSIPDDTDTDAVLASTATSGRVEDFAAAAVDRIENFVVFLCVDSVIGDSKPLVALENVMKASPPSTIADQKRFRARILAKVLDRLIEILSEHKALALDPRLQGQFSKLAVYAVDKLFQGWFAEHAALVFDFIARLLESVEEFMANAIAHGRIPLKLDTNLLSLYRSLNKTILFELKGNDASKEKLHRLMTKCSQHQRVVFSAQNGDPEFYRCLISRLWRMLSGTDPDLQMEATAVSMEFATAVED